MGLEVQTLAFSQPFKQYLKPPTCEIWPLSAEVRVSALTNTRAVQSTLLVSTVKLNSTERTAELHREKYPTQTE